MAKINKPKSAISRSGTAGRLTQNTQGRAASKKRTTPSASGDTCRRPSTMMAKLTPQMSTITNASRMWRGCMAIPE